MAWATKETVVGVEQIQSRFPEGLESDYVCPVLGRSLVEHLKSHWLTRILYDYKQGYEANKVKEQLQPELFSEKDWHCIAAVCGFPKSWAYRQFEEFGG
jgi:hypothetical protein